jgi:hypothetical protein
MKRTPLKRKTPLKAYTPLRSYTKLKARKPMNKISKKKRQEMQGEIPIRKALWERCKGCCEWCGRPASQCLGGLHPHEKIHRSQGGKLTLKNSVMVCNTCQGIKGHNLKIIEPGHKFKEEKG